MAFVVRLAVVAEPGGAKGERTTQPSGTATGPRKGRGARGQRVRRRFVFRARFPNGSPARPIRFLGTRDLISLA